jgi:hypothetical protein
MLTVFSLIVRETIRKASKLISITKSNQESIIAFSIVLLYRECLALNGIAKKWNRIAISTN